MTSMVQMLLLMSALQSPDGAGPSVSPPPPSAAPAPQAEPVPDTAQTPAAAPAPGAAEAPAATPAPASEPVVEPAKKKGMPDLSGLLVSAVGGAMMAGGLFFGAVAAGITVIPDFPGGAVEQQGAMNAAIVGSVFFGLVGAVLVAVGVVLVAASML